MSEVKPKDLEVGENYVAQEKGKKKRPVLIVGNYTVKDDDDNDEDVKNVENNDDDDTIRYLKFKGYTKDGKLIDDQIQEISIAKGGVIDWTFFNITNEDVSLPGGRRRKTRRSTKKRKTRSKSRRSRV